MNERIKQLMGQTLDEKFAGTWSVMDLEDLTKFADRFAELLVRECATICKDTAEKQFNPLYSRESDGATVCYKKIVQHFGVEE